MDDQLASEPPASPSRVLVANLPNSFVEQLRKSVKFERGIELRQFAGSNIELLIAARGIDILLYGAPHVKQLPPICTNLLAEFSELRIIVIDAGGTGARLYWLGLRARWLGEVNSFGLLKAIRSAYRLNQVE